MERHIVKAKEIARTEIGGLADFIQFENEVEKQRKVFLGGTCNNSTWREKLIPMLEIPFYNPVVEDWNEEAQAEEKLQKEICGYQLFVITSEMTGVFSIAEVIDSVHKNPNGTFLCILDKGFSKSQKKSLKAVSDLVEERGGYIFNSLKDLAKNINVEKEKTGVVVKMTIQSDPIPQVGINGIQASDMIVYIKGLFQSLDNAYPCRENERTIDALKEAQRFQIERTKDREERGVEGKNEE